MNELHSNPMDRREFLQAGIAATAATGLVAQNAGAQEPKAGNTGTKPI
jgi:TAT (twin-arginine translocation) pathway signal sequence